MTLFPRTTPTVTRQLLNINNPTQYHLSCMYCLLQAHPCLETFYSDSVPLCIDICVTGDLAGFKADFIPGTCHKTTHIKTNTDTEEVAIIGQGTVSYWFLDNNGDAVTLKILMLYAPMSKY